MSDHTGHTPQGAAAHVVLVGLPGAGKSTIAPAVAARIGCDVVELDAEVERIASAPIAGIFGDIGEAGFRRFEVEATRELLKRDRPAIVSVGGGWIGNARARRLVPSVWRLIYLRVSPRAAARRLAAGSGARPLLAGARSEDEVVERLEQMAAERVPLYEHADATIDTEAGTLPEIVEKTAELVSAFLSRASNALEKHE